VLDTLITIDNDIYCTFHRTQRPSMQESRKQNKTLQEHHQQHVTVYTNDITKSYIIPITLEYKI